MGQPKPKTKFRRAYRPTTALAKAVTFEATPEQRDRYEIGGGGVSLHWPEIDEDLSIAGLMAGVDWESA